MNAEKVKNVPLYVHVPPSLKERFEEKAASKGTTLSALARDMMEKFLAPKKKRTVNDNSN